MYKGKKVGNEKLRALNTYFFISLLIALVLATLSGALASENQPNNNTVGYELLDNNNVLHIWNIEDDYYFNTTSGLQFTNHYDEYWSKNVFCGGYYIGNTWHKLICVDELPFSWSINTDNNSFINITGYKDVSYHGYTARFALRYHLKPYDTRLSVIPYVKNIGTQNIPFVLGFAWHIRDIAIDDQEENNTLVISEDDYYNSVFDLHNLDMIFTNTTGYFFIQNTNSLEHIFLEWNNNLTYIVQAKPKPNQYNSPITLGIKIGTLGIGQEKSTRLGWADANPFCENVGTDGDEDLCFYAALSADNDTNYSDANFTNNRFPRFKITHSAVMPFGCNRDCKLYRQSEVDGDWEIMDITSICYNYYPGQFGKCSSGYCNMLHTWNIDNRTQWDLCIAYSGRLCSENGNVYCGLGHLGGGASDRGDYRVNMSYNANTPITENTTITPSNLSTYNDTANCTYDFSDVEDNENESLLQVRWLINGVEDTNYTNQTSINTYNLSSGDNLTCQVKGFDDSYFSPTGEENWSSVSTGIIITGFEPAILLFGIFGGMLILLFWLSKNLSEDQYPAKTFYLMVSPFIVLTVFAILQAFAEWNGAPSPVLNSLVLAFQVVLWVAIFTVGYTVFMFMKKSLTVVGGIK